MTTSRSATRDSALEALPARGLSISVIVNTCDRAASLRTLLYALHHQTYRDFEVVAVVGPTRDDTIAMLTHEFPSVHVVRCPEFNLSVSRNHGLANAAGDIIAFIDDDAIPSPTWLAQLAASYIEEPAAAGLGGRTYNVRPETAQVQFLFGRVSPLADTEDIYSSGSPPEDPSLPPYWRLRLHGTNMSYRRDALLAIGGFDERFEYLYDDCDVAIRLAGSGHRLEQLREAVVYHAPSTGRNRGASSPYDLNWYCLLRSQIFFALKNGPRTAGWHRSLLRSIQHVSHLYAAVGELLEERKISQQLHRKARQRLRRGWLEGFATGLFGSRRIPGKIATVDRALTTFSNGSGETLPAIPPIPLARDHLLRSLSAPALRVALLSAGFPPHSTEGVARSTQLLARGLAELGHEVHVITSGSEHRVEFRDGVYVRYVRSSSFPQYARLAGHHPNLTAWLNYSQSVFEEVRSVHLNHRLDLVDAALWSLDGLVTAVAKLVPVNVRVVTAMKQISSYFHGDSHPEHLLMGDLETDFLHLADAVTSNSQATAQTLQEIYRFDTGGAGHHVVPYGIAPAGQEDLPRPPDRKAGEGPQVLFVGRLESRKGILDLLAAIPRVLAEHPTSRFLLAGADNSTEDGFFAHNGCDYATFFFRKHPDLRRQVQFLGYVTEEKLEELYRSCDLFVAPSLYESFGLIYLEAMNFGRPVIGCRIGGAGEIILDETTGLLVPPESPVDLATAIARLLADPDLRCEMGRAGRARLLEKFTYRQMAKGFSDAYHRTLERVHQPPTGVAS